MIKIGPKGAQGAGYQYEPHLVISGLTPLQEALLVQGGDATSLGALDIYPALFKATATGPALLSPDGNEVRLTRLLVNSGTPMAQPPSGSVGNNGAVIFGTAAPSVFSGFVYFHNGVLFAGSPAGWYWTVMSSTTVAQVFDNVYLSGSPKAPVSPTPFTGRTGPGAFTGLTNAPQTFCAATLPANALGPNGVVRIVEHWSHNGGSSSGRIIGTYLGGQPFFNAGFADASSFKVAVTVQNRGATNRQFGTQQNVGAAEGGSQQPFSYTSLDTTGDLLIQLYSSKDTAAAWLVLEGSTIEVIPGA